MAIENISQVVNTKVIRMEKGQKNFLGVLPILFKIQS